VRGEERWRVWYEAWNITRVPEACSQRFQRWVTKAPRKRPLAAVFGQPLPVSFSP
jgi:hypothetical protein